MLLTLLVLWVVVVPALTLAGAYALSGVRGRRSGVRGRMLADLTLGPVRIGGPQRHLAQLRVPSHASRSRDHALIQR
jgi:hypothetical protein